MLEIGLKGEACTQVDEENIALTMGSGNLEVFATPAMVALMEQAASESVNPFLKEEESTVGTNIQVKHISATSCGRQVSAESVLEEIDGKRLVFSVKAFDPAGLIGEGTHERFIIHTERFLNKANCK